MYHYVLKKLHNLFPEMTFIDPPDPVLPYLGDGDIYEVRICVLFWFAV